MVISLLVVDKFVGESADQRLLLQSLLNQLFGTSIPAQFAEMEFLQN